MAFSGSFRSTWSTALLRSEWTLSGSRAMDLPNSSTARWGLAHVGVGAANTALRWIWDKGYQYPKCTGR